MLLSNELDELKQEEGIGRGTNSSILFQDASAIDGDDELVNGRTNLEENTITSTED